MASKTSLLIDFDNIIKPNNLTRLVNKIKPLPESKYHIGLVLVIPHTRLQLLEKVPLGYGRVNYINTQDFVNDIVGYAYIIYDKKKKLCEIMGMRGWLTEHILNSVLTSIPNDVTLWVGIEIGDELFENLVQEYKQTGFQNPYICKTSPLGFAFSYYGLCMLKQNDIVEEDIGNDVEYVLKQFIKMQENNCTIKLRFTDTTLKYFKQLSRIGVTLNKNGSITQKELSGVLNTGIASEDQVFPLELDRISITSGEEEEAMSLKGHYSFHTHPEEAYKRHRVSLGWPSAQDYVAYLSSVKIHNCILHIIVALEGLYVLSMNNYWIDKQADLDNAVDFIRKYYDIPYESNRTSEWYVRKVNSISYQNYPIFMVQFFNWENANDVLFVSYRREGVNCFASDKTREEYNRLYNAKN